MDSATNNNNINDNIENNIDIDEDDKYFYENIDNNNIIAN